MSYDQHPAQCAGLGDIIVELGEDEALRRGFTRDRFLRGLVSASLAVPGAAILTRAAAGATTDVLAVRPPSRPTGLLRIAIPGEPAFLDPADTTNQGVYSIHRAVYDTLVYWNPGYTGFVPGLAESWRSAKRQKEWIFNLRRGVRFHDGALFNSTAVRRSLEHIAEAGHANTVFFAYFKAVDDSDPYVARIVFTAPQPEVLGRLAAAGQIVSPRALNAKLLSQQPVGTGPYRFKRWDKGSAFVLEANPRPWNRAVDGPYFQEIQFVPVSDKTTAVNALASGQVDVVIQVPPQRVDEISRNPNLRVSGIPSWVEKIVIFRTDVAPTNDVRFRRAFAHAIDRKTIVEKIFFNAGVLANTPMPSGLAGSIHRTAANVYPYNPSRARTLLREAGLDGASVNIATCGPCFETGGQIAEAMGGWLGEVGIKARAGVFEPGSYIRELFAEKPQYQVVESRYQWRDGGTFRFRDGVNHSKYTGTQLLNVIKQVEVMQQGAARTARLKQLQELWMQELPHLPLYFQRTIDGVRRDLQRYSPPRDGLMWNFRPVFRRS